MSIFKNFNIAPADSPESSDVISNVKDIVSSGKLKRKRTCSGRTCLPGQVLDLSTATGQV